METEELLRKELEYQRKSKNKLLTFILFCVFGPLGGLYVNFTSFIVSSIFSGVGICFVFSGIVDFSLWKIILGIGLHWSGIFWIFNELDHYNKDLLK